MGMPGTETALKEMLSRILGELMASGKITKIADDIYCGGDTVEEVKENWAEVLSLLKKNGLKLSAHKTVICPQSVNILGWVWQRGTIKASPHKIAALSTIKPPDTVTQLKSFIGAFRFISRVIPHYANTLAPLEAAIRGKSG